MLPDRPESVNEAYVSIASIRARSSEISIIVAGTRAYAGAGTLNM